MRIATLAPQSSSEPPKGGWVIQVGAAPQVGEASALLARAKQGSRGALDGAKPFTEAVKKGKETLFRARFAGLDADGANAACRNLKRSGISCFAARN